MIITKTFFPFLGLSLLRKAKASIRSVSHSSIFICYSAASLIVSFAFASSLFKPSSFYRCLKAEILILLNTQRDGKNPKLAKYCTYYCIFAHTIKPFYLLTTGHTLHYICCYICTNTRYAIAFGLPCIYFQVSNYILSAACSLKVK